MLIRVLIFHFVSVGKMLEFHFRKAVQSLFLHDLIGLVVKKKRHIWMLQYASIDFMKYYATQCDQGTRANILVHFRTRY